MGVFARCSVIIYHIHNNAKPRPMQRLNHFFHFKDAHGAVVRVCAVGTFRDIVIGGVISPVKAG